MGEDRREGYCDERSGLRLEKLEGEGILGQESENCRSEEFGKANGYIRVGISQGNIRWHCGTSGREGGNALESVIHQTEVKWQVQENYILQRSQQCYEQDSFQDGGCQVYNGSAGSGGLHNYLGHGRSILLYKSRTRIEQVFRLQIQKQGLCVQRRSIWLHPKSTNILSNSENGYQLDNGETQHQNYNVHG
ncbi:MAG: hypothetical protein EZS28_043536 [Streblomastix strix]|uniref:Uncharacterized protein n=1 Tax=Streblomastix strix TaxID=222440 RepID=A0A5J4TRQ1_9EUKA|nr:MAG: hypothetical protein EZS28_043536 [Streblomastix strix]